MPAHRPHSSYLIGTEKNLIDREHVDFAKQITIDAHTLTTKAISTEVRLPIEHSGFFAFSVTDSSSNLITEDDIQQLFRFQSNGVYVMPTGAICPLPSLKSLNFDTGICHHFVVINP